MFSWMPSTWIPDSALICFGRDDDYFFGVLHSAIHELWARRMGTQLREAESGFRYTPTTCFETFPLPWAPGEEPAEDDPLVGDIAAAARRLDELREGWLNPPQWIEPIERAVEQVEDFSGVPEEALPLLKRSAVMARAAKDNRLKKRTLTNLYNERPTWLKQAHRALDAAVIRAYASVDPDGGWDEAWAGVYEPFGAGNITDERGDDDDMKRAKEEARAARVEVDEEILGNLLRLNLERAQ